MAIVIENLTHIFLPDSPFMTVALRDVTMTIEKGEFVGIIGHTGSGKSTLIQHFNGLLKPTSGMVTIEGVNTSDKGAALVELRRKVGLVFQYPEHQLFEETVDKDVAFGPANIGLPAEEVERRVSRAIAQVGLDREEVGRKSPFELSGGQRRRVAIAGVLAMEPEVLILDEPSAGLDPRGREEILKLVCAIHAQGGRTVIIVSHNMDEVARVAGRVIVMNHGGIAMDGTPEEIFARSRELQGMGLDVPAMASLCAALRQRGIGIPQHIITVEAMRDFVLQQLGRGSHV
jgi:energy-coupling factor transport system ATP-binding protein